MKKKLKALLSILLAAVLMLTVIPITAGAESVAVSDSVLTTLGRTYYKNNELYFNYSASGFSVRFTGTGISAVMRMIQGSGYAHLSVYIDRVGYDVADRVIDLTTSSASYELASGLTNGIHTVTVRKRTEVDWGCQAILTSLSVMNGSLLTPPGNSSKLIEFIGDSNTTGYGDLAIGGDGYNSEQQDANISYAAYAAGNLGADYNLVAKSGASACNAGIGGVSTGTSWYECYQYTNYWNEGTSRSWDFSQKIPQVIVINLGENDKDVGGLNEYELKNELKDLIYRVRNCYAPYATPKILVAFSLEGYPDSYINAESQAVDEMNNEGDSNVFFYRFETTNNDGPSGHPSWDAHRTAGMQLSAKIASIAGWDSDALTLDDCTNGDRWSQSHDFSQGGSTVNIWWEQHAFCRFDTTKNLNEIDRISIDFSGSANSDSTVASLFNGSFDSGSENDYGIVLTSATNGLPSGKGNGTHPDFNSEAFTTYGCRIDARDLANNVNSGMTYFNIDYSTAGSKFDRNHVTGIAINSKPGTRDIYISGIKGLYQANGSILRVDYDGTSGQSAGYRYFDLFDTPPQSGWKLVYDVYLEDNIAGIGGIDLVRRGDRNWYARDEGGYVDEYGMRGHPNQNIGDYAYNRWFHREIPIPDNIANGSNQNWTLFAFDYAGQTYYDNFSAYFDNIRMIDGNGNTVEWSFRDSAYEFGFDGEIYYGRNSGVTDGNMMSSDADVRGQVISFITSVPGVVSQIKQIPAISAISTENLAAVSSLATAARSSYNSLNSDQQFHVNNNNYAHLTEAESKISKLTAAQNVMNQISQLPQTIKLANESAVTAARSAYNSLDSASKSYVTNLATLTDAETSITNAKSAATKVLNNIKALPSPVTLANSATVKSIRTAYNALDTDQRKLVTNYATLTAAEKKITTDTSAATSVVNSIKALPSPVTLANKTTVTNIRAAYNALYTEQQNLVTNLATLTAAENKISSDTAAATSVVNSIKALPNPVTLANKTTVTNIRKAYNALYTEQQKLVTNLATLTAAENKISSDTAAANSVANSINALPATVTLADKTNVESIRAAYNSLSAEQKAIVTNISTLTAAESKISSDIAKVNQVIAKISALPEASAITRENKDAVIAARTAFDALDAGQKAYVTNSEKLLAAETALNNIVKISVNVKRASETDMNAGSGTVSYSVNGTLSGTWTQNTAGEFTRKSLITVTAVPDENSEFLYWINSSNRVVCWSATYSFYALADTNITACFKTHDVTHTVIFKDIFEKVVSIQKIAQGEDAAPPVPLNYYGYTFSNWSGSFTNVTSDITVIANYTKLSGFTLNVTGGTVTEGAMDTYSFGSKVTATAPAQSGGKYFSGWYSGGSLVCDKPQYTFYITGNLSLVAKFEGSQVITQQPIISLTVGERTTNSQNKDLVQLVVQWNLPEQYTVASAGIIRGYDLETAAETLTLNNVDGITVKRNQANSTSRDSTYSLTVTMGTVSANRTLYAVGYLTYIDGQGVLNTIYTPVRTSSKAS